MYLNTFACLVSVTLGIACNYICITLFREIPYYIFALYLFLSIIFLVILLLVIPTAANFYVKSLTFNRQWKNYIKVKYVMRPLEKKYLLAYLKGCSPVKIKIGQFFFFKASTTYKCVLFMLLYTMKAVIIFGKKKYKT